MHVNKGGFISDLGKVPEKKGKEVSPKAAKAGSVGKEAISKAREAEDIRPSKPVRGRSLSLPPLEELVDAKGVEQECAKRTANGVWVCKERRPNKLGGYVYVFRVKDEYDDLFGATNQEKLERRKACAKKGKELFPAVESLPSELGHFQHLKSKEEEEAFVQKTIDTRWESMEEDMKDDPIFPAMVRIIKPDFITDQKKSLAKDLEVGRLLQQIGYRLVITKNGTYFEAPDRDALRANWEKFKSDLETAKPGKTSLPSLDIIGSGGIAGDLEFVESYFCHHALLSEGVEFLHDHHAHIIPAIQLMFAAGQSGEDFKVVKNTIIKSALWGYKRIWIAKNEIKDHKLHATPPQLKLLEENLGKAEAVLGSFVDTYASLFLRESMPSDVRASLDQTFSNFGTSTTPPIGDNWVNYMARRFYNEKLKGEGPEVSPEESLQPVWDKFLYSIKKTWELIGALEKASVDIKANKADPTKMHELVKRNALETSLTRITFPGIGIDDLWAEVDNLDKLPLKFGDVEHVINQYYMVREPDVERDVESVIFRPFMMEFMVRNILKLPEAERPFLTLKMLACIDRNDHFVLYSGDAFNAALPLLVTLEPKHLSLLLGLRVNDGLTVFDEIEGGDKGLNHLRLWDLFDAYASKNTEEDTKKLLDAVVQYKEKEKSDEMQDETLLEKFGRMKQCAKFDFYGFSGGGKLTPPGPALEAVLKKYYLDQLKAFFPWRTESI